MSRSVKKGPFIAKSLYKKVIPLKGSQGKKIVQTYSRSSTIIPEMIDFVISVHNGKAFIPVYITENLVGHKLGEFAPTRFFKVHSGNR